MSNEITGRQYGMVKEAMAVGQFPAESGSAQIPEVIMAQSDGALDFRDAERVAAMRAMGKANNLFRNGNRVSERQEVIEALRLMIRNEQGKDGRARWRFPKEAYTCVAAVAVDELCWDACPRCSGAGVVPHDYASSAPQGRIPMVVCDECDGTRKRTYTTAERVNSLALAWLGLNDPDDEILLQAKDDIRADRRLHKYLEAIDWAQGKLREAERMAVEGTAQMLERW